MQVDRVGHLVAGLTAGVIAFTACAGGGDESTTSLTEITLLTTTTEAPPFEPETTVSGEVPQTTTAPETTAAPAPETTTTSPVETTVPETTTPPPPATPFTVRPDGIGAAAFGAAPDGVIDFVSSVLGPPTADTGWIDPFEIGPCGGTELRQVGWDTLVLEFGDFSNVAEGRQHFYGYFYGNGADGAGAPAGIATEAGLGLGSPVSDLLEAHPDVDLFSGDEFLGPNFQINDALRGTLTGLADNDVITSFIGGLPCDG